jgi:predicted nuclease of restriction endonuclease-like (RecB) superfamily
MTDDLSLPEGYTEWLRELKDRIRSARQRAALAVNSELVQIYWHIGNEILERQTTQGWGAKVIDQIARDLRATFPDMTGLSPRNLKYMRAYAQAWPSSAIVQAPLAQLPWYHQIALLEKLSTATDRLAYASAAVENGWSRNVLVLRSSGPSTWGSSTSIWRRSMGRWRIPTMLRRSGSCCARAATRSSRSTRCAVQPSRSE